MIKISTQSLQKLRSPLWRINHLYKILDKDGNLGAFKLNNLQTNFVKERRGHKRNKIVKYRQGGFTTFRCIEMLDKCLWKPGTTCAIIAHEREAVSKIFKIVKRAFDNLPPALKPQVKYNNANELQFVSDFTGRPLDSVIYVALKLRGTTVRDLHISESAYIEGEVRQELNSGAKQAVPLEGSITEETTANGLNEFYDEVQNALNTFHTIDGIPEEYKTKVYFFKWIDEPQYTIRGVKLEDLGQLSVDEQKVLDLTQDPGRVAWRRFKIKEFSSSTDRDSTLSPEAQFRQEYPLTLDEAFQASGARFFEQELIDQVEIQPFTMDSTIQGLRVWQPPQEGKGYVVGVDPSKGMRTDYTGISVWDTDYNKVAEWHDLQDPDATAITAQQIAEYYNKAFIIVENNLQTTIINLKAIYPSNLLYQHVRRGKKKDERTKELGFPTNTKTRPMLLNYFKNALKEETLNIPSATTLSEMKTFIITSSEKVEHAPGKHDDMLFADMLAVYAIQFSNRGSILFWV